MGMIHSVIIACVEGHWFMHVCVCIYMCVCMLQGRENRIQEWQEGIKAKRLTNYEEAINRLPKWIKHLTHTEMGLLTESCSSCRSAHFEVMCYRTRSIFNDFFPPSLPVLSSSLYSYRNWKALHGRLFFPPQAHSLISKKQGTIPQSVDLPSAHVSLP